MRRRLSTLAHNHIRFMRWFAVLLLAGSLASCESDEASEKQFEQLCIEAIKMRLRAPSTFNALSVTADHKQIPHRPIDEINRETKEALQLPDGVEKNALVSALGTEWSAAYFGDIPYRETQFKLYVEYEAKNALGVPLRSFSECAYTLDGRDKFSEYDNRRIKVDGRDHADWLVNN